MEERRLSDAEKWHAFLKLHKYLKFTNPIILVYFFFRIGNKYRKRKKEVL
jgi:hypothetical protein